MDEAWIVTVSLISAKAFALLGLWLRLHWRSRRERQRQQYLLQVTKAVTANGQVELNDWDSDGHHLNVKIVRVSEPGEPG
ncbi:hypothetical protein ACWGRV_38325 [Streptomyces sp. NPDC055663]